MRTVRMSGLYKDFVASHLRHQVQILQSILVNIENSGHMEEGYIDESLRHVVTNLHRLRKLCEET